MARQIFNIHDPGVSEVGTVVVLVLIAICAIIVVALVHGAALGMLGRRGLAGTIVAALIGFGGAGWLLANDGVLRFDRVDVQDDGTWRLRNGLGMYVDELPPDAPRSITVHLVRIPSKSGTHLGCEVHIDSGGSHLLSTIDSPRDSCDGPAAALRRAGDPLLAAPAHRSSPPNWPRDAILAVVALLLATAAARVARAQLALRRRRAGLAQDDRWITVRLEEPTRVELGTGIAPHTWTPAQITVRLDDRPLDLDLGKADFPVPTRAGRRGVQKLVAAGFHRPPPAEGSVEEPPLTLDLPAGHALDLLATVDPGGITPYPDMPVVVTDSTLAPRAAWLARADLPARTLRNRRYMWFWLAVFAGTVGSTIADFF